MSVLCATPARILSPFIRRTILATHTTELSRIHYIASCCSEFLQPVFPIINKKLLCSQLKNSRIFSEFLAFLHKCMIFSPVFEPPILLAPHIFAIMQGSPSHLTPDQIEIFNDCGKILKSRDPNNEGQVFLEKKIRWVLEVVCSQLSFIFLLLAE